MTAASPIGVLLRLGEWVWNHVPRSVIHIRPTRSCGRFAHVVVSRGSHRRQYCGTFFLRNRPQLELIRRLAEQTDRAATLRMAVLGCSNGAEVYSILATIRWAQPAPKVIVYAVDTSREALEAAQNGTYSFESAQLVGAPIFDRLGAADIKKIFDGDGTQFKVKSWIREGISWHCGDAGDPRL